MILIFHFLCFLAQCIVSNIYKKISKNEFKPNDSNQGVSFINQLSTSIINRNSILRQPVYQDGTLKFFPPVYIQRYETVALILEELASEGKVHKVFAKSIRTTVAIFVSIK